MSRIKFTQTALKQQKDLLKRYNKFLPTLKLKKQQLQATIRELEEDIIKEEARLSALYEEMLKWIGVLELDKDSLFRAQYFLEIEEVKIKTDNIAGIPIPVYLSTVWKQKKMPRLILPVYTIPAIRKLKNYLELRLKIRILKKQEVLLQHELRKTTQRVNLFEKIKIPECEENIRFIKVYLGDMEVAAVCRSKIAKTKLQALE